MGAGDISLAIMITAQNQASSVIQGLARDLGPLGVGMAAIGVGAIAAGVAAVKMAGDYQSATTTLVTGAGESVKNLGLVRQGLLDISVATGTSTDALVKSMFLVESAGYHGAQGLQVETIAAEGAKVAHADLTQTADILTTSLHDFNLTAGQSTPVMNSLIVTVQNGKMTMDNLNESMKTVLPVAGALHVPLADVEGALSTMAIAGDKGSIAGTHLAMMLKMLANPASTAQKEMSAMGIDSIKLAQTMQTSLPAALQMIQNAVAQHFVPGSVEYNRAIATILGGSKSGIAGLELMGQNMNTLVADTKAASDAFRNSGKDVQGWAMVQGDFNQKMDELHATLNVVLIDLGAKMLPVLTDIVQHGLIPFVNNLDYIVKNGSPIITFLQGSSVGATLLRDALIGLAVAVAAVKIALLVESMASFIASVPGMLSNLFLVQSAVTSVGTATTETAAATATASAGMSFSLAGIAVAFAPLTLAAKYLVDNRSNIIDTITGIKNAGSGPTGNGQNTGFIGNWWQQMNQQAADAKKAADDAAAAAKKSADATRYALDQVSQDYIKWLGTTGITWKQYEQQAINARKQIVADGLAVQSQWAQSVERGVSDMTTANDKIQSQWSQSVQRSVTTMMTATDKEQSAWAQSVDRNTAKVVGDFGKVAQTADQTVTRLKQLNNPLKTSVDNAAVVKLGLDADLTRKKLLATNGPYYPVVNVSSIAASGNTADQTRKKLLAMNGPYYPLVNAGSVAAAGNTADQTRNKLLALNGSSTWNAYVNTYQNVSTNYLNTGGPVIGHGFASGVTNNPIGGWYDVGERGPEKMYVPQGASILPHGINPTSKGAFGLSGAISGSDKTMNITVQLDSRNMMQALGVRQAKEIRIQGNYRNG